MVSRKPSQRVETFGKHLELLKNWLGEVGKGLLGATSRISEFKCEDEEMGATAGQAIG